MSAIDSIPVLDSKDIERLVCTDVGDLMNHLPGVQLRSYGGVGGLKTISVRGLGSQHSAITVNGVMQVSNQTGQIDLGRIQVEGIEKIALHVGNEIGLDLPVSADCFGNVLEIVTQNSRKHQQKWQLRNSNGLGSYGFYDHYFSLKRNLNKFFVATEAKFRAFEGSYPYEIKNGLLFQDGLRKNGDLLNPSGTVSMGYEDDKNRLLVQVNSQQVIQGLPGAVVLYLPSGNQRLNIGNVATILDYRHTHSRFAYRLYGNISGEKLRYIDSSFLNQSGGINDLYSNESAQIGSKANYHLSENYTIQAGIEEQLSRLNSTKEKFANPERKHTFSELAGLYRKNGWEIDLLGTFQFVSDELRSSSVQRNYHQFSPFLRIEKKGLISNRLAVSSFYRRSFRMPTFNELYYNNIGNAELKPELADQIKIGASFFPFKSQGILGLDFQLYQNWVKNKIVAIPTKNLFIWSIQNLGTVSVSGMDTRLSSSHRMGKLLASLSFNYSYQRVIDITDNSITYGHQVAYYPLHSGGGNLVIDFKKLGLTFNSFVVGSRYSLNENITANFLDGFSQTDIAIFSRLSFGKHKFRAQFTVKNIFNQHYAYVKNYIMPGRNYLLNISYAI